MYRAHILVALLSAAGCLLTSCKEPFAPEGPGDNRLVVYGVLNTQSDTQYVRLSRTSPEPPGTAVHDASVLLTSSDGRLIAFHDTTVLWNDAQGHPAPTAVYVAYNAHIQGGSSYRLTVTTPGGLSASAEATALKAPAIALNNLSTLQDTTERPITVTTLFGTLAGAYVSHFYVDYYALVNGGWELKTEEVPVGSTLDVSGDAVPLYPVFSLVALLTHGDPQTEIAYDKSVYWYTLARIRNRYEPDPVVYLQVRFILTQVDESLYTYYYLNNGPADTQTLRLDRLDFTNITGGLGVFGSGTQAICRYRISIAQQNALESLPPLPTNVSLP